MKAVFPGKPQAKLHAVSTCQWEGKRLVAYISGSSLLVLGGPNELLQTISHDDHEALTAVAINAVSGKIAACTATTIYLYTPFGQEVGAVVWTLQHTYKSSRGDSSISCLSWGTSEELLVGGAYLTLLSTDHRPRESWSRPLASIAKYAALCPDTSIIATTGWHDRLVKIWKRSWFGEDDERFDISYLPHPATVTGMRWHTPRDAEQHNEAILYTTCADNKLRIWAHTDPHDLRTLQSWAEIDLLPCVDSDSAKRYVIIVDNWELEALVEKAAQQLSDEMDQHALKALMDISYRDPDICIVLDDRGNMSAWGLERVGCKARPAEDLFNIVYSGKLDIEFVGDADTEEYYLCPYAFGDIGAGYRLNLLLNFFDGRLEWMSCPINQIIDTSNLPNQFRVEAMWTGHADVVVKITSSNAHSAVISLSSSGEIISWRQNHQKSSGVLVRNSLARVADDVSHLLLLSIGTHAIICHDGYLSMWQFEHHTATELCRCEFACNGRVIDLFEVPCSEETSDSVYIAILTNTRNGVVWQLSYKPSGQSASLKEFCKFQIDNEVEMFEMATTWSDNVKTKQLSGILSTSSGYLTSMNIKLDIVEGRLEWIRRSQVPTGIEDSSIVAAGRDNKVAVVDSVGTTLTIWDCRDGQLELTEQFESHQNVHFVKWMRDSDGHLAFVVGFPHKLIVYGQKRYDYLNQQPAWTVLRLLDVSQVSNLYVADCTWLGNGDLLVGAGNQMFLYGSDMEISRPVADDLALPAKADQQQNLSNILAGLCSEHQIFHPAFLAQLIAVGKLDVVHHILLALHRTLKFYTEGDDLASDLGLDISNCGARTNMTNGHTDIHTSDSYSYNLDNDEEYSTMTEETASVLIAKLSETRLPFMINADQAYLINQTECVGFVERHQRSADDFGIRYLFFLRNRALRLDHGNAVVDALSWKEIVWAFHSSTQDILVDLTLRQYNGRMMWADARDSGMFMWITDIAALRNQFEVIARNEYSKTETRNPIDCSLYYLALKKKPVLMGLWRMATWNREQAATLRLLSNNFDDSRWKTAALKNAYALLGRRRFEYAAAFFLLADHLKDAVGVLATQLGDIQLAIAVARVYEGDDGPVLRYLLEDRVLPQALQEGNAWLAHWAFSMIQDLDPAMRSLLTPLLALISQPPKSQPPPQNSKSYLNADPSLLSLYTSLRDTPHPAAPLLKYPSAAISPSEEWDAVIRTARLYARAGCTVLALDTLQNHTFPPPIFPKRKTANPATTTADIDGAADIEADAAAEAETQTQTDEDEDDDATEAKKEEISSPKEEPKVEMRMGLLDGGAKRKTVVAEPSAASIFDSFDF